MKLHDVCDINIVRSVDKIMATSSALSTPDELVHVVVSERFTLVIFLKRTAHSLCFVFFSSSEI